MQSTRLEDFYRLSDLAEAALVDLEKAEAHPRYLVDMNYWMDQGDEYCYVCMAGALMAFTEGYKIDEGDDLGFINLNYSVTKRLVAVDRLRTGQVVKAAVELYGWGDGFVEKQAKLMEIEVNLHEDFCEYEENRVKFKSNMRSLIAELRAVGY